VLPIVQLYNVEQRPVFKSTSKCDLRKLWICGNKISTRMLSLQIPEFEMKLLSDLDRRSAAAQPGVDFMNQFGP
jgi:hypothetical protein